MKRRIREAFQGYKRLTKDQRMVLGISMILMLYLIGFLGFVSGFKSGTGTMPFGSQAESIVPSGLETTTSAGVLDFVKDDQTDLEKYDIGFNCVEYALLQARNAHWKGIDAVPVRIDFESGDIHLILGFPTEDKGWMFLQPQGEVWVKPRVGGMFLDKKIIGLYYLSDFVWQSIEEVCR